jgi:hypothetical protein
VKSGLLRVSKIAASFPPDTSIIDFMMMRQRTRSELSLIRIGERLREFVDRCRWHRIWSFTRPKFTPSASAPFKLGRFSRGQVVDQVFDGDLTLDGISRDCKVTLESREGSITIMQCIEESVHAKLKAAGAVTIGEGINQRSIVDIIAGGDVTIGQMIGGKSRATIVSTAGKIELGSKIDDHSEAKLTAATSVHIGDGIEQYSMVTITAPGDITIDGNIKQHVTADIISIDGAISIGRTIGGHVIARLTAGKTVQIGEGLDPHSDISIHARGDVTLGQKIDQHSSARIITKVGSINIGQGLSGGSNAVLVAPNGSINIGGSVDAGSTIHWNARHCNCPHQNGRISRISTPNQ